MIGAAGLTATAPAAYYVVTSRLDAAAWSLWAANLMFAMNQIQYVQLRKANLRFRNLANRLGSSAQDQSRPLPGGRRIMPLH
jgi:hypothetical protein